MDVDKGFELLINYMYMTYNEHTGSYKLDRVKRIWYL